MTAEPSDADGALVLRADTWEAALLPDLDPELLGEVDREIIFDALVEFAAGDGGDLLEVEGNASGDAMGADAPLLVPGTRIHVRAGDAARDTVRRLVRMAAVFAILGSANPAAGFVGLGVDLVLDIFEKTSRLDPVDAEVARTLIELRRSSDESLPSRDDLADALPDVDRLDERLASLQERGVVESDGSGWRVTF